MSEDKKQMFSYYFSLLALGADMPTEEYNFDANLGRKHRFDFAWIDKKIAVEINGNAWGVKGGGRHGQDKDLEKLNLAASMGWRVFQFSPAMLKSDPERWIAMVLNAIR